MIIEGSKIELIPAALSDRQRVYEWCFHSETTKCHSGPPDYPEAPIATAEEFFQENGGYEDYYFTGERPQDGRGFLIVCGGEPVGFVSYASFHLKPGVTELDIWMNSEAHCGKGYGTDALVALSEYLHKALGIHTLIMRPSARNARAVRAYNKAGFIPSGKPIEAYMPPENLPIFGDGDYGPGGDALLVKEFCELHQISPCGINCLNCGLHEGNLTDEVKRRGAEFFHISPNQVKCRGCRWEQGKCLYVDSVCATWTCAEKKGVAYCFECDEFPCAHLAPAADKAANRAHNIKLYNLCWMKRTGIDAWLKESADILKLYFEGELIPGQGPVLNGEEKST